MGSLPEDAPTPKGSSLENLVKMDLFYTKISTPFRVTKSEPHIFVSDHRSVIPSLSIQKVTRPLKKVLTHNTKNITSENLCATFDSENVVRGESFNHLMESFKKECKRTLQEVAFHTRKDHSG